MRDDPTTRLSRVEAAFETPRTLTRAGVEELQVAALPRRRPWMLSAPDAGSPVHPVLGPEQPDFTDASIALAIGLHKLGEYKAVEDAIAANEPFASCVAIDTLGQMYAWDAPG